MKKERKKHSVDKTKLIDDAFAAIGEVRKRMKVLDKELDELGKLTGTIKAAVSDVPIALANDAQSVAKDVADVFDISPALLFSSTRREPVSFARFCTWAILTHKGYTSTQIGRAFKRDHGAVAHGIRRVADAEFMGARVANSVRELRSKGYVRLLKGD